MINHIQLQYVNKSPLPVANKDPWDPLHSLIKFGRHRLTSVEMTVTNLCNMRCGHCAVGDALTMAEGSKIPLSLILKRLDEVEHLTTISLTGGEPSYQEKSVREYIIPLLKYARDRGVKTQINSNVTMDLSRYEMMVPFLDVMHISFNYLNAGDFHTVGFARAQHGVSKETAGKLYDTMVNNTIALSKGGLFVSAESMINYRTHGKLGEIHQLIVEMGCKRHEVHPMYPSSFASNLPMLSLEQIRSSINKLLDARNKDLWMLFGTLPFYHCNPREEDQRLLKRLSAEPNLSVRNDPDGRNRLNVNLFTGEVYVTDFTDLSAFGNVHQDRLETVFQRWTDHPVNRRLNCYCPQANCCGPNLLVADAYYPEVDFTTREAL